MEEKWLMRDGDDDDNDGDYHNEMGGREVMRRPSEKRREGKLWLDIKNNNNNNNSNNKLYVKFLQVNETRT